MFIDLFYHVFLYILNFEIDLRQGKILNNEQYLITDNLKFCEIDIYN